MNNISQQPGLVQIVHSTYFDEVTKNVTNSITYLNNISIDVGKKSKFVTTAK